MCGPSSCGMPAQLLRGTRDPPGPGIEPVSPALAGGFLTTVPPGKSMSFFLKLFSLIFHSPVFSSSFMAYHSFSFFFLMFFIYLFFLISHPFYTHQCIHVSPNLPIHHTTTPTRPPLSPAGVHTFFLYFGVSISVLQISSCVPFSRLPIYALIYDICFSISDLLQSL